MVLDLGPRAQDNGLVKAILAEFRRGSSDREFERWALSCVHDGSDQIFVIVRAARPPQAPNDRSCRSFAPEEVARWDWVRPPYGPAQY